MREAVELGRRKLHGLADKEYADSVRDFAEAENLNIEAELKRRSMKSKVRQEEAAARLAELSVVDKELDLIKKLQNSGVTLYRDENGNLTALPLPTGMNLGELGKRWEHDPPPLLPLPEDPVESKRSDPRVIDGQRALVEAMRYLAQADPVKNRPAIELIAEHIRTRFGS